MSIIRLQTCRICKYAEQISGEAEVECRRFPPTATAILVPVGPGRAAVQAHVAIVRVNPDFYCGEFKPRLAEPIAMQP